jgi:hypothetical protein
MVRPSEALEPTEVGFVGGPQVTLSGGPNRWITAHYDISDGWLPVTTAQYPISENQKTTAQITFTVADSDRNKNILRGRLEDAAVACNPPTMHPNGIAEYRPKLGRDQQIQPDCFGTVASSNLPRAYVSNNPVAIFHCAASDSASVQSGHCKANISTPESVEVRVYYQTLTEPDATGIPSVITSVLEQVSKVFVAQGELKKDEVFGFEKIRGAKQ